MNSALADGGPVSTGSIEIQARMASRLAGVLFIVATAATMASQIIMAPLLDGSRSEIASQGNLVALATLLEVANALASAGIAIALYPVLRRFAETTAVGYVGLRVIEGALGATAAAFLAMSSTADNTELVLGLHDTVFLLVLIVFSVGTLLLYPVLFAQRLVPSVLSLWGLVGGLLLLLSCTLILFDQIEIGGTTDMFLSLPIWINEMALALWLLTRGLDVSGIAQETGHAS